MTSRALLTSTMLLSILAMTPRAEGPCEAYVTNTTLITTMAPRSCAQMCVQRYCDCVGGWQRDDLAEGGDTNVDACTYYDGQDKNTLLQCAQQRFRCVLEIASTLYFDTRHPQCSAWAKEVYSFFGSYMTLKDPGDYIGNESSSSDGLQGNSSSSLASSSSDGGVDNGTNASSASSLASSSSDGGVDNGTMINSTLAADVCKASWCAVFSAESTSVIVNDTDLEAICNATGDDLVCDSLGLTEYILTSDVPSSPQCTSAWPCVEAYCSCVGGELSPNASDAGMDYCSNYADAMVSWCVWSRIVCELQAAAQEASSDIPQCAEWGQKVLNASANANLGEFPTSNDLCIGSLCRMAVDVMTVPLTQRELRDICASAVWQATATPNPEMGSNSSSMASSSSSGGNSSSGSGPGTDLPTTTTQAPLTTTTTRAPLLQTTTLPPGTVTTVQVVEVRISGDQWTDILQSNRSEVILTARAVIADALAVSESLVVIHSVRNGSLIVDFSLNEPNIDFVATSDKVARADLTPLGSLYQTATNASAVVFLSASVAIKTLQEGSATPSPPSAPLLQCGTACKGMIIFGCAAVTVVVFVVGYLVRRQMQRNTATLTGATVAADETQMTELPSTVVGTNPLGVGELSTADMQPSAVADKNADKVVMIS